MKLPPPLRSMLESTAPAASMMSRCLTSPSISSAVRAGPMSLSRILVRADTILLNLVERGVYWLSSLSVEPAMGALDVSTSGS